MTAVSQADVSLRSLGRQVLVKPSATAAMVSAQKQEGLAVFLDHENSFDVGLAVANGLNADEDDGQWVYKQPDTFEESVELIGTILKLVRDEELIPADAPICIVADSLASMVPNSKAEKFDKMAEGTAKDKDQLNMNDNTAGSRHERQLRRWRSGRASTMPALFSLTGFVQKSA